MKKILLLIAVTLLVTIVNAQHQFGKITIEPYIPASENLDAKSMKLLETKLLQAATVNDVSGGFDRRFIIVPKINILSEKETASIPQKTSMKVEFTICVGDGVSGALFKTLQIETNGIGDSHYEALHAAIRRIRSSDPAFETLIKDSKARIVSYYNTVAPGLIKEAKGCVELKRYEDAIHKLAIIPLSCDNYAEARELITQCSVAILKRNNMEALNNAKAAWSAHPNVEGAEEAAMYIAQVIVSDEQEQHAIQKLTDEIYERMVEVHNQEYEMRIQELALEKARLESVERIETAQIQAAEQETTSFYEMLPNLAYSIIGWFF